MLKTGLSVRFPKSPPWNIKVTFFIVHYKFQKNNRKFITFSHSEKKTEFIEWLKENQYIDYNEVFLSTRKETEFFNALEKSLKPFGFHLDRQYIENGYRFDGYIKDLDIVIEYDENNHQNYDKIAEVTREKYINNNHKKLLRVNDLNDIYYNIGYVIKNFHF